MSCAGDLSKGERVENPSRLRRCISIVREIMVLMLSVHPSRQPDLLTEHVIRFSPGVAFRHYRDAFGKTRTGWWRHLA